MLNYIIEFAIKNKLIVGLFVFLLIGLGSYEFTKLPIDAVPDITDNQVQVITIAPSFGATDIERLVTFPIEQANNNIAGLVVSGWARGSGMVIGWWPRWAGCNCISASFRRTGRWYTRRVAWHPGVVRHCSKIEYLSYRVGKKE